MQKEKIVIFAKMLNKERTQKLLQRTKELQEWIKTQL